MAYRFSASLLTLLLVGGALVACSGSSEAPRVVTVAELAVGDCFSTDAEQKLATLAETCESPHLYEVLSVTPTSLGDAFPGDAELASEADALCAADFAALGADVTAGLVPLHLVPSETSWAAGDRAVVCLAADAGGAELTGSRLPHDS